MLSSIALYLQQSACSFRLFVSIGFVVVPVLSLRDKYNSIIMSQADGNTIARVLKSGLDANKYATKKTIAQGMLDIALLTANASQLKYILQVGERHEFYTLMLTLIIVSIVLQVVQGIVCVFVGTGININEEKDTKQAHLSNNIILSLNVLLVIVNIIISVFEMKEDHFGGATEAPKMM